MGAAALSWRYPGAQPFADDELSQRVFFGREQAVLQLTNQILSTRLLVVYAKSGLGKSSLLRAGVSPRLRDAGCLPLHVRVNDTQRGPLHSLFEGVLSEAQRQGIEHVAGHRVSLWSFFKTLELWRDDLLLVPVLVLDQFEELFTLQDESSRRGFLEQLGYLVRGVCPPAEAGEHASPRAPALHVVLSLREDYLGLLEGAARHIPQILDQRFRLPPLTLEAAQQAMIGPASVADATFASPPFQYSAEAIELVTSYLSRRRLRGVLRLARHVEPFQLQLVCQRVERVVSSRAAGHPQLVSARDIGGEVGLKQTLQGFFADTLRALPRRRERAQAARLCQRHLIGASGQRLSVEEGELRRQLGISTELLQALVQSRLLRTEARAGNTYYELSHDALLEPVLASQRLGAVLTGWLQLGLAGIVVISMVAVATWIPELLWLAEGPTGVIGVVGLLLVPALVVSKLAWTAFHRGLSRVRRFAERNDADLGSQRVSHSERRRALWLIWGGLIAVTVSICYGLGLLYRWLELAGAARDLTRAPGPGNPSGGWAELVFVLLAPVLAVEWCRAGLRQLLGASALPQSGARAAAPRWPRAVAGVAAALLALPMLSNTLFQVRCSLIAAGALQQTFLISWADSLGYQCLRPQGAHLTVSVINIVMVALLVAASVYFLRGAPPARSAA